ncbi:hypothetical protein [Streptomyces sp. NPDC089799]|uniref:hypothetical protein n=1 Tax=Streptomyces sp. NPDC089799 TaxID=3155066 RepID=UPI00344AE262
MGGTARRWAVGIGAAFVVFWLCLWLARAVSFGWLPEAEADRWAVAGAFAGAMAAAVGGLTAWWAGRGAQGGAGGRDESVVRQAARADGVAEVEQVAGSRGPAGTRSRRPARKKVSQKAKATGESKIGQVGGDRTP